MNLSESLRAADRLRIAGRLAEARQLCLGVLSAAPGNPDALHLLGLIALQDGDPQAAVAVVERAIGARRGEAQFHATMGTALRGTGDFDAAISSLQRALRLKPAVRLFHSELAITLHAAGRPAEARASFQRALALGPEHPDAHFQMAFALLSAGDYERGWVEYEFREGRRLLQRQGLFAACPEWRGEDPAGKNLFLHAEQGFGDTIQFARYVPLLAARGARMVLAVPEELRALLGPLPGVREVVSQGPLPAADHCCALGSLPLILGTRLDTIPADVPYLAVPSGHAARWAGRFADDRELRVGVVWAGKPTHANDRNRSMPAAALAPLAGLRGVTLYSLQKGGAGQDLPRRDVAPVALGDELADFADTAAVLAQLDVVVSVDTAVAHLAGALGRPTLLMLPAGADWRWLNVREDSPWYPTMKLVRQGVPGDWESVVRRVAAELSERAARR